MNFLRVASWFFFCLISVSVCQSTHALETGATATVDSPAAECVRDLKLATAENAPGTSRQTAFVTCLSAYLKLQTINPPGSETLAVVFLEQVFHGLGIPTIRIGNNPLRSSLVASLGPGMTSAGWASPSSYDWGGNPPGSSVILLNHTDVVPVQPEQWANAELPFSGKLAAFPGSDSQEQFVWGRGALDMKGLSILELFAMASLKARKIPLTRAVHFVAVADEEQSELGAREVLLEMRKGGRLNALRNVGLVLNEGGFTLKNLIGPETWLHLVAAEEKGGAWLKLRHRDWAALIDDLNKLKLIAREDLAGSAPTRNCHLKNFLTDKAKINVVPSKVEFSLACDSPLTDTIVEAAFSRPKLKLVTRLLDSGRSLILSLQTESSGHGAVSMGQSALEASAEGLAALGVLALKDYPNPSFFRYQATPATRSFIDKVGEAHAFRWVPALPHLSRYLAWVPWLEQKALALIGSRMSSERLFRTACSWTGFTVDEGGAEAWVDCRTMSAKSLGLERDDGGHSFSVLLKHFISDKELEIGQVRGWNFTQSPVESGEGERFLSILEGAAKQMHPQAAVTPYLFPAGSDSHLFRDPGHYGSDLSPIPSFGFFPAGLTKELLGTQHGSNERFPVDEIEASTALYPTVLDALVR